MSPIEFLLNVWEFQTNSRNTVFFCLSTKSAKGGKWKDHFLQWPITRSTLRQFFERYDPDEFNLYFCPHGFSKAIRQKEYAIGTRMLWADLDEKNPAACDPVPQIAWRSSPGRYAALWKLTEFQERGDDVDVEGINQALTYKVGADLGGWAYTKVLRIPGTPNHKYRGSPEGKLLWNRDSKYGLDKFPDPRSEDDGEEENEGVNDPHQILAMYRGKIHPATKRLLKSRTATAGKRSEVIYKLENELYEQGVSTPHIFVLIKHSVWNKFAGRRNEDAQLKRELEKVHARHDRPSLSKKPKQQREEGNGHVNGSVSSLIGPVRLSGVEPETVHWLWYPYIPLGKVTLLEGDPGLGKSWLTMALSTHTSLRKRYPEQETGNVKGGRVILMSAEDGMADTMVPRLISMGADRNKVFAIPDAMTFGEEDMEIIDDWMERIKPALVIADPLVAYMGGQVDLHKANETREVMARLSRLAEKHHTAVVGVRHLTKGARDKSIYRGIGSIDLTAAARSVLMLGRNPENPNEGRVICHIKCNLAPLGAPMAYALRAGSKRPFHWEGSVEFSPDEIFKAEPVPEKGNYEEAQEFLKTELADGPRLAEELIRDSEAKGIDPKHLKRGRQDLNVQEIKRGKKTLWKLPA